MTDDCPQSLSRNGLRCQIRKERKPGARRWLETDEERRAALSSARKGGKATIEVDLTHVELREPESATVLIPSYNSGAVMELLVPLAIIRSYEPPRERTAIGQKYHLEGGVFELVARDGDMALCKWRTTPLSGEVGAFAMSLVLISTLERAIEQAPEKFEVGFIVRAKATRAAKAGANGTVMAVDDDTQTLVVKFHKAERPQVVPRAEFKTVARTKDQGFTSKELG